MLELWEMIKDKVMYGLLICLGVVAVILLIIVVRRLIIYYTTRNRVDSAKRIYNAIRLGEPKEDALSLFRGYTGGKDQYSEEALLTNGKREEMICLLLLFGRGELGEIRLTYVDDRLVQKQQNGIW